tara:strand:+ start:38 stop:511 length:474 start_codon:yes stop_codon:yes gene_type:complete
LKNNYFIIFFILSIFTCGNVKSIEATPNDALSFIVKGDFNDALIENVNFSNCMSEVKINTLFFGKFTIKNDWNKAIWNSKGYRINDNNGWELVISCKDKCSSMESSEGVDGLLGFATLFSGIDYEKNIILEIKSSTQRVDRALEVIKKSCPGEKSLF